MPVAELLPWLNVLLVPMSWHILRTESRITRLEAHLETLLRGQV